MNKIYMVTNSDQIIHQQSKSPQGYTKVLHIITNYDQSTNDKASIYIVDTVVDVDEFKEVALTWDPDTIFLDSLQAHLKIQEFQPERLETIEGEDVSLGIRLLTFKEAQQEKINLIDAKSRELILQGFYDPISEKTFGLSDSDHKNWIGSIAVLDDLPFHSMGTMGSEEHYFSGKEEMKNCYLVGLARLATIIHTGRAIKQAVLVLEESKHTVQNLHDIEDSRT